MPTPIIQVPSGQPFQTGGSATNLTLTTPIITGGTIGGETITPTREAALTAVATSYNDGFSVAMVTDRDAWDSVEEVASLACDTRGGFSLQVEGVALDTAQHWVWLRFNGAKPTDSEVERAGFNQAISGDPGVFHDATPNRSSIIAIPNGIAGCKWSSVISCPAPASGRPRQFFVKSHYWDGSVWASLDCTITWLLTAELINFGIGSNAAKIDRTTVVTFKRI